MEKPYLDYKFLGIQSFLDTMDKTGTAYSIFENDNFTKLFEKYDEILKEEDTIISGIITRDGHEVFFTEFGLKITRSYHSYIVFIFNHHPRLDELDSIINELESIIESNLDTVDVSEISNAMSEGKDKSN